MSKANFKLSAVCPECRWVSSDPKQACKGCGRVICPSCGGHCAAVAAWPGESVDEVGARYNRQVETMFIEGDGDSHVH